MHQRKVATSLQEDLGSIGLDPGRLLNLTGRGPSYHRVGGLTEQVNQQDRLELNFGSASDAMRAEDLVRGVAPYSTSGDGMTLTIEQGVPANQKQRALDVLKGAGVSYKMGSTSSESAERATMDAQRIKSLWGNVNVGQLSEEEIDDMLSKGYAALDECDPLSETYEAISDAVGTLEERKRQMFRVVKTKSGYKRKRLKRQSAGKRAKARAKYKTKKKKIARKRKMRMRKAEYKIGHKKAMRVAKRYQKKKAAPKRGVMSRIGKAVKGVAKKALKRLGLMSHVEYDGYGALLSEAYAEHSPVTPYGDTCERLIRNAVLFVEEFNDDPEVADVMVDVINTVEDVALTADTEQEFFEGIKPVLATFQRSVEILEEEDAA